ncbi:hypothetical protein OIV83_001644 [Microbotryomycetes sp. JL201]|nr:hypothetical protein OIV83_001644 [Microbotryomycetes sp. JL201]
MTEKERASWSSLARLNEELAQSGEEESDRYLVDWTDEHDQENPRNWSKFKKCSVAGLVSFMTFSIYIGSAIYVPAISSVEEKFRVSQDVSVLGLSLFVLAYGMGPMLLAPLQESPWLGRTPVYVGGLALFTLFQIPIMLAREEPRYIALVLCFRFMSAFVGSACLASGGASLADLFGPKSFPIALGAWQLCSVCGAAAGPVIGGFAAQEKGWRWPFIELTILGGISLVVMTLYLPETLESNILLRKAARLRQCTGDTRYQSRAERETTGRFIPLKVAGHRIKYAFQLCGEPFVLYANVYSAVTYAVFYLFFASFPLVYEQQVHHFNTGVGQLPYIGFLVTGVLSYIAYVVYQRRHIIPRLEDPSFRQEHRLELGIAAGIFIPVSLLIFGWTARPQVHWFWPIFGAALYTPGIYLVSQTLVLYTLAVYPSHASSILAGQTFFRSVLASIFPLIGPYYYRALGLGGGCSLLAGVSIILVALLWVMYKWGDSLRRRSNWAE